jgi:hypothetical protein
MSSHFGQPPPYRVVKDFAFNREPTPVPPPEGECRLTRGAIQVAVRRLVGRSTIVLVEADGRSFEGLSHRLEVPFGSWEVTDGKATARPLDLPPAWYAALDGTPPGKIRLECDDGLRTVVVDSLPFQRLPEVVYRCTPTIVW